MPKSSKKDKVERLASERAVLHHLPKRAMQLPGTNFPDARFVNLYGGLETRLLVADIQADCMRKTRCVKTLPCIHIIAESRSIQSN